MSRPEQAAERRARGKHAVGPALTCVAQRQIMRKVLAQTGPSQTRPALRRIVRARELAQLDREEVLVQRSRRAAAGADEVVRHPLAQFCFIGDQTRSSAESGPGLNKPP